MSAEKKPRLFYWEEAEDAWCPCDGLEIQDLVGNTEDLEPDEIREITFKRIDMTDEEFAAMPES